MAGVILKHLGLTGPAPWVCDPPSQVGVLRPVTSPVIHTPLQLRKEEL